MSSRLRPGRFIGSLEYSAKTAMMWNLAADENGGPILSGTDSCNGGNPGCRRESSCSALVAPG
jgi:hypothetical protein